MSINNEVTKQIEQMGRIALEIVELQALFFAAILKKNIDNRALKELADHQKNGGEVIFCKLGKSDNETISDIINSIKDWAEFCNKPCYIHESDNNKYIILKKEDKEELEEFLMNGLELSTEAFLGNETKIHKMNNSAFLKLNDPNKLDIETNHIYKFSNLTKDQIDNVLKNLMPKNKDANIGDVSTHFTTVKNANGLYTAFVAPSNIKNITEEQIKNKIYRINLALCVSCVEDYGIEKIKEIKQNLYQEIRNGHLSDPEKIDNELEKIIEKSDLPEKTKLNFIENLANEIVEKRVFDKDKITPKTFDEVKEELIGNLVIDIEDRLQQNNQEKIDINSFLDVR